jgi:plasmid stability protein
MIRLSVRLPDEVHQALQARAAEQESTIAGQVRLAVKAWLAGEGGDMFDRGEWRLDSIDESMGIQHVKDGVVGERISMRVMRRSRSGRRATVLACKGRELWVLPDDEVSGIRASRSVSHALAACGGSSDPLVGIAAKLRADGITNLRFKEAPQ